MLYSIETKMSFVCDIFVIESILKCILFAENVCILIEISLQFVPECPVGNESTLVELMAWRRTGDMSLSEPMMNHPLQMIIFNFFPHHMNIVTHILQVECGSIIAW